jgi:hypothetical protein
MYFPQWLNLICLQIEIGNSNIVLTVATRFSLLKVVCFVSFTGRESVSRIDV